ncbi:hypothetical protein GCM10009706_21040 [Curtobacterium citreum]|nr:hypothetical protein GCM10009706_21040 [Curtobacterium citreum]
MLPSGSHAAIRAPGASAQTSARQPSGTRSERPAARPACAPSATVSRTVCSPEAGFPVVAAAAEGALSSGPDVHDAMPTTTSAAAAALPRTLLIRSTAAG